MQSLPGIRIKIQLNRYRCFFMSSDKYSVEFLAEAIIILKYFDEDIHKTAELLDVDPKELQSWYNRYVLQQDDNFKEREKERSETD